MGTSHVIMYNNLNYMPNHRPTTDEWIKNAKLVHGDRYDYSLVDYKRAIDSVDIICPVHGKFSQKANNHLNGSGCLKCAREKFIGIRLSNTSEFIKKASIIHNNKYNYSEVDYKRSDKKVAIICPTHGNFLQTPREHLSGRGCIKCVKLYSPTTDEWIEKAKQIHGDLYDYSIVNYIKCDIKIDIKCQIHGIFRQTPNEHLNGRGCPKCSGLISNGQLEFLDYLKLNLDECEVQFDNYRVDGFKDGIIYEFLGDYYHGNPIKYAGTVFNKRANKYMKELYKNTFIRFDKLKRSTNHKILYIWEYDWNNYKNGIEIIPKILEYGGII